VSAASAEGWRDLALCAECAREIGDPFSRRYRYPFSTCARCGPRLTIATGGATPDRRRSTLARFEPCPDCAAEYRDPGGRHLGAEAIACHRCGPRARLVRLDGAAVSFEQHSMLDDVDAAGSLLQKGEVVALQGLGGFHLACDASRPEVVARLRSLKGSGRRPFALMAADLEVVRRYCRVGPQEEAALLSPAGPIVVLEALEGQRLGEAVAPGLNTLGFMLPTTPLHALVLRRLGRPMVMTSGNRSGEPAATQADEVRARLGGLATFALVHDGAIANRVDDSVVRRIGGVVRPLRLARGLAPLAIALPPGLEPAPQLLALGGQRQASPCLLGPGAAVLAPEQGDLDDARALDDAGAGLELLARLLDHRPRALAADAEPGARSTRLARRCAHLAAPSRPLELELVERHHALVAACLAENGWPLEAPAVLGLVLDAPGPVVDGEPCGGELLLADYLGARRLAVFKPVPLPGGAQPAVEAWQTLYAHLRAEHEWAELTMNFEGLALMRDLGARPREQVEAVLGDPLRAPRASSCGALLEAVARALDLCGDRQAYPGEAAARLEAIVDREALQTEDELLAYPFTIPRLRPSGLPYVEPVAVWSALLGDLVLGTSPGVIAARFHRGLARVLARLAEKLAGRDAEGGSRFDTVALAGACFRSRVLFEQVQGRLERAGFRVLAPRAIPAGEGGLALGQAAVAAARRVVQRDKEPRPCASESPVAS
jgi:hydrogenase maturation protein HypF